MTKTPPSFRAFATVRFMLPLFLVGFLAGGLTSCNTTAGLGRDLQKVGNTIEDTSRKL